MWSRVTPRNWIICAPARSRGHLRPTWVDALIGYLHATSDEDRPLLAMVGELGLSAMEVLAVAVVASVEDDARGPGDRAGAGAARRLAPTLALVAAALERMAAPGERPVDTIAAGEAVGSGVLRLLNDAAPLPERTLAVPPALVQAMAGRDGAWPGVTVGLADIAEIPLAPSLLDTAARQARGLVVGGRALVLRTASRAEGRSLACAVAAALGLRAAFVDGLAAPTGLGPWLSLRGLVPVACLDLGPGERAVLPALPGYSGPRLVLAGSEGTVETASGGAVSWAIPVPTRDERAWLWSRALGEARSHSRPTWRGTTVTAAAESPSSAGCARQAAAVDGRDRPEADDLRIAAWTGEGGGLDALAQPLTDAIPDEALVIPHSTRAELDELRLRCPDARRPGSTGWAPRPSPATGRACALFVGPSGTGKTLGRRMARHAARDAAVPRRPGLRHQQVHRRDREEPRPAPIARRAGRGDPAVRRGRLAVRRRTEVSPRRTTGSPTPRRTTCSSGSSRSTGSRC